MSLQHSTDRREAKGEARGSTEQEVIVVPLELGALRILKQDLQGDGSIGVEVIATTDRARYSATRTPRIVLLETSMPIIANTVTRIRLCRHSNGKGEQG
jgi:hypothetical protein